MITKCQKCNKDTEHEFVTVPAPPSDNWIQGPLTAKSGWLVCQECKPPIPRWEQKPETCVVCGKHVEVRG